MTEFILCLAAGCLLLWVVFLKMEINIMNQKQRKLISLLKDQTEKMTGDLEVTRGREAWGKKVKTDEVDTSWVQKRDTPTTKPT